MRFYSRGLDAQYVYPFSKADVKAAFGTGLLGSASFGSRPKFEFDSRHSPQPKIEGTVILAMAVRAPGEVPVLLENASLYVYRVEKKLLSSDLQVAIVSLLHGSVRNWLETKVGRSETEVFGVDELVVELRDGQLLLHETRFR